MDELRESNHPNSIRKHVDLEITGFYWDCPACEELNAGSELPQDDLLECPNCSEAFKVGEIK